jgi:phosphate transport system substrate-binding protein
VLRFSFLLFAASILGIPATAADVNLSGAGATFPAPIYEKWFQTFEQLHAGVHVDYSAGGSGSGVDRLKAGTVDFAASDAPLTDKQIADFGRPVLQLPSVAGAVVPIYNIPQISRDIRFTPEVLAGIYLGRIKRWDDAELRAVNRGVELPAQEIAVVHRQDSSGTTFIWTSYLASVSGDWKTKLGAGTTVNWPVGRGAEQNAGVAAAVEGTPWSIGYVEWIYAIQGHLNLGLVRNAAGKFPLPMLDSVATGLSNPSASTAYPIVSFTYLLVPANAKDPTKAAALRDLLAWIYTYGQNQAGGLGYVALPVDVAARAAQSAAKIR